MRNLIFFGPSGFVLKARFCRSFAMTIRPSQQQLNSLGPTCEEEQNQREISFFSRPCQTKKVDPLDLKVAPSTTPEALISSPSQTLTKPQSTRKKDEGIFKGFFLLYLICVRRLFNARPTTFFFRGVPLKFVQDPGKGRAGEASPLDRGLAR